MGHRIAILAAGGTIASASTDDGAMPKLSASAVADLLPTDLRSRVVLAEDITAVLSPAMRASDMLRIVQRARALLEVGAADGVVVTHGTATMQESAYLADILWDRPEPIVFTGAMIPGGDEFSDARPNLRDAVLVASDEAARDRGALLVAAGNVHHARDVTKAHKSAICAFTSLNYGPVGIVDERRVVIARHPLLRKAYRVEHLVEPVPIVQAFSGMTGEVVDMFLADARGLVISCFPGRGALPPDLVGPIAEAAGRGVPIVLAGSAGGRISATYGGSSGTRTFLEAGAISGGDLIPAKARLLLMVLLALPGATLSQIREEFSRLAP